VITRLLLLSGIVVLRAAGDARAQLLFASEIHRQISPARAFASAPAYRRRHRRHARPRYPRLTNVVLGSRMTRGYSGARFSDITGFKQNANPDWPGQTSSIVMRPAAEDALGGVPDRRGSRVFPAPPAG